MIAKDQYKTIKSLLGKKNESTQRVKSQYNLLKAQWKKKKLAF